MGFDTEQARAADDTTLAAYRWAAKGTARAVLVVIHGMAEHARRYDIMAAQLAAAGIEVHAFDLRGHGATADAADHGFMGTATTWQTLVDDVAHLYKYAQRAAPGVPVFLFGHSLGSFIAQRVLQQRAADYAGAILCGTDTPSPLMCRLGAFLAAIESSRLGATGTSTTLQRMTIGAYDRRLERRLGRCERKNAWITGDAEALDAYEADPACGFALRTHTWRRVLDGIARTNSPHARRRMPATLPLLLIAGLDDPMGGFGRGPARLARALASDGQRDIELRLYDDARHELLHERVRDTVIDDIRVWIERHLDAA